MTFARARVRLQRIGAFLSGMILPNIAAFLAWGLITALFTPAGWLPNPRLAALVSPMLLIVEPPNHPAASGPITIAPMNIGTSLDAIAPTVASAPTTPPRRPYTRRPPLNPIRIGNNGRAIRPPMGKVRSASCS